MPSVISSESWTGLAADQVVSARWSARTAPPRDATSLTRGLIGVIGLCGLALTSAPHAVGMFTSGLAIGWVPLSAVGLVIMTISLVAWPLSRFMPIDVTVQRGLRRIAGTMIVATLIAPIVCLLIYFIAPVGPVRRYYVDFDTQVSRQMILTDSSGSQTIVRRERRSSWPSFRAHECIDASRINGALGMNWMRVVAMTPRPARGHMWWDVTRDACFEAKSPAELAER